MSENISSNVLFHFTKSLDNIVDILMSAFIHIIVRNICLARSTLKLPQQAYRQHMQSQWFLFVIYRCHSSASIFMNMEILALA